MIFLSTLVCLLAFSLYFFFLLKRPQYLDDLYTLLTFPCILFLFLGFLFFWVSYLLGVPLLETRLNLYASNSIAVSNLSIVVFILINLNIRSRPFFRMTSLDANTERLLFRLVVFASVFTIPCLLQYFLIVGVENTGIYKLFFDPVAYFQAREASVKFAESSLNLTLYLRVASYANLLLIPIGYLCIAAKVFSRRLNVQALFLIILCLSNVNGSKGAFIYPFLNTFVLIVMIDHGCLRSNLIKWISSAAKLKISVSFLRFAFLFVFLAISLIALMLMLSSLSTNRLIRPDIISIILIDFFKRAFGAFYFTGLMNISAMSDLDISWWRYFGGFPGFSLLFHDLSSHIPVFMQTGAHAGNLFRGIVDDTNNMNSSGLFFNSMFWGPIAGPLLFSIYLLINCRLSRLLSSCFRRSQISSCANIFGISSLALTANHIPASTIKVFPLVWTMIVLTLVIFRPFLVGPTKCLRVC